MHYHIILTENCNSECKYCYEKSLEEAEINQNTNFKLDFSSPERISIDIDKLNQFIKKDKQAVIIFYGGEPLLEVDKIKEIIDKISVKFRMQTNGKLLDKLPIDYLKKIDKILISIDGDKKRTDYQKGVGTYEMVINNLRNARKLGYKGEFIARMTISGFSDIYKQVNHLLSLNLFDSIHWQLDAGFYKSDFDKNKFNRFVKEYNKEITRLIRLWFNRMKTGKVLRIYPFIGITESLLKKKKTSLRCGAGYEGYAITTNGKIIACPIMNCIEDFVAGSIEDNPKDLKKFYITGPCLKCEIKDICGGRCLYSNKAKLWPKEGEELICKTIKHLIKELEKILPKVKKLISKQVIKPDYFDYEKYFGPEIIP